MTLKNILGGMGGLPCAGFTPDCKANFIVFVDSSTQEKDQRGWYFQAKILCTCVLNVSSSAHPHPGQSKNILSLTYDSFVCGFCPGLLTILVCAENTVEVFVEI